MLLDFFDPGEFDRLHYKIVCAGQLGWGDIRFLNRLLAAHEIFGDDEMPISRRDAERFLELAERAMAVA